MGCCSSTPSHTAESYPAAQEASSSRAINPSVSALRRPSTVHTNTSSAQPVATRTLSEHFNKPLRQHTWTCKDKVWTRHDIDSEREAFFDTRVTGREEIWLALKSALGLLWSSEAVGKSSQKDESLATAQMIIEAAGVTIPTGDLANGVYDSSGAFYQLPEWVVADPSNIASACEDKAVLLRENESDRLQPDDHETMKRREEKGKGVIAEEDMIKIKSRLSDRGGPDVMISVGKEDSVRLVTRRVFEESGLIPPKSLRLVYMGKMLKETETLEAQGWHSGQVINAFVFG